MSFETWFAFALASSIVFLIPGPNIVLTVNYAIRDGKRQSWQLCPAFLSVL